MQTERKIGAQLAELNFNSTTLELLDVNGVLVRIDEMGCQKEIAAKIVERGGDYVLTVMDYQPSLSTAIQDCFEQAIETNFADLKHDEFHAHERGHGRVETRHYKIIMELSLPIQADLAELSVVGMCYHESALDGKASEKVRYFIGSREPTATNYENAFRLIGESRIRCAGNWM